MWSAATARSVPGGTTARLWHAPLKRRTPRSRSRRRKVNGYRPRLTPGHLIKFLAKGQSSSDLILTESPRRLGFLLRFTPEEDPAVDRYPARNRQTTVRAEVSDQASVKQVVGCRRRQDRRSDEPSLPYRAVGPDVPSALSSDSQRGIQRVPGPRSSSRRGIRVRGARLVRPLSG